QPLEPAADGKGTRPHLRSASSLHPEARPQRIEPAPACASSFSLAFHPNSTYLRIHPDIVMAKSGAGAPGGRRKKALSLKPASGDRRAGLARLVEGIEPGAAALGVELGRVKLSGQGEERRLQVVAEDPATGQLVVEQCMALSRRVSDRIDETEEQGEELVQGA